MRTRRRPLQPNPHSQNINRNSSLTDKNSIQGQCTLSIDKQNLEREEQLSALHKRKKRNDKPFKKFNDIAIDQYFQNVLSFCENYQILSNGLSPQNSTTHILQLEATTLNAQKTNERQVSDHQRKQLVEWVIEIHRMLKLRQDTLYMSIYLIDEYVKRQGIHINKYQLLGLTSLFIAGKYEEIVTLKMKSLTKFFSELFKVEDILRMESDILKSFQFQISRPNLNWFLNAYLLQLELKAPKKLPPKFYIHCEYLMELCLLQKLLFEEYQSKHLAKTIIYITSMQDDFLSVDCRQFFQKETGNDRNLLKNCLNEVRRVFRDKHHDKNKVINERYPNIFYMGR